MFWKKKKPVKKTVITYCPKCVEKEFIITDENTVLKEVMCEPCKELFYENQYNIWHSNTDLPKRHLADEVKYVCEYGVSRHSVEWYKLHRDKILTKLHKIEERKKKTQEDKLNKMADKVERI